MPDLTELREELNYKIAKSGCDMVVPKKEWFTALDAADAYEKDPGGTSLATLLDAASAAGVAHLVRRS